MILQHQPVISSLNLATIPLPGSNLNFVKNKVLPSKLEVLRKEMSKVLRLAAYESSGTEESEENESCTDISQVLTEKVIRQRKTWVEYRLFEKEEEAKSFLSAKRFSIRQTNAGNSKTGRKVINC